MRNNSQCHSACRSWQDPREQVFRAVIHFSEGQSPDQQGTGMEAAHPSGCCSHLALAALEMLQNLEEEGSALAQKQRNWKTRERNEWYHTKEAEHFKLGGRGRAAQRLAVDEGRQGALPFIGPILRTQTHLLLRLLSPVQKGQRNPLAQSGLGSVPEGFGAYHAWDGLRSEWV